MSPLTEPTKLTLRKSWQPMDADAAAYITAVETADVQALEEKVKIAIDNFVLGCKADGIWSAIKASCILAGARTLAGALVPLVGTAPTNVGPFVAGDYSRKTGLVGNGSTKYLNSNRNNNADPQNFFHAAVYRTSAPSETAFLLAAGLSPSTGRSAIAVVNTGGVPGIFFRARTNTAESEGKGGSSYLLPGLVGMSRTSSSNTDWRVISEVGTTSITSEPPLDTSIGVFANNTGTFPTSARLAFYSIGESLDLAKLDARVTDLINAFGAAIP